MNFKSLSATVLGLTLLVTPSVLPVFAQEQVNPIFQEGVTSSTPESTLPEESDDLTTSEDVEITVTDTLSSLAQRKPVEFNATLEALTPYVVETQNGIVSINAPDEVIKTVDQESYAAILDSINKSNQILQTNNVQSNGLRRISLPRIPWKQIISAVKAKGKWVWYKAHLCTGAVVSDWYRITAASPHPKDWIIPASNVCIKAMRK